MLHLNEVQVRYINLKVKFLRKCIHRFLGMQRDVRSSVVVVLLLHVGALQATVSYSK